MKSAATLARQAMARIEEQCSWGPRQVGSPGHRRAQQELALTLAVADRFVEHTFTEKFFGRQVTCRNLWARFAGNQAGRLLLGTHYDTRPWADRDGEATKRKQPVLGANDGASGTALLLEFASELLQRRDRRTIDIVLFDAEDWHDIDGKQVSLGARRFVADLAAAERPDAAVILDMIAGRDLMLDIEVGCEEHPPSLALTRQAFQLGQSLDLPAFTLAKAEPTKWIECDHSPLRAAGIASTVLIDIDYPPWHTTHDAPEACDVESLRQIAVWLEATAFGRSTPNH